MNKINKPPIVVFLFVTILSLVLIIRDQIHEALFNIGYDTYAQGISIRLLVNVLLIVGALILIKKYKLSNQAGIGNLKAKNWLLLLFPFYIVILNFMNLDEIKDSNWLNFILFLVYVISIGFSEELLLRGFLQSYLIKISKKTKRNTVFAVVGSAFIFGLLHLIHFDKGIYGELTQVGFATFIGVMFGGILLRTNNMFGIAMLHALIDFAAKLDGVGIPVDFNKVIEEDSLINSLLILVIISPCLIYGLILTKKAKPSTIQ
ncbi:CPBP family intramembrane glutamic endopeptidase [Aquimarina mytili]|uniref:CPBP family intramembrane metalloprotease n=1 Tax=Aquimarina mytili TaxID=874423 RepID=A0A936ZWI7_9FLAO|nr:type II CAAX endopeptidase family protein [Aquimarina mytili]MBL0683280.1 CPBP family intramembrane metalloprotease [Aquimarina mytili]